jgi:hypothetical protein
VRRAGSREVIARLTLALALAACGSDSPPPVATAPVKPAPVATPDAPAPAPALGKRCEEAIRNYTSLLYWAKAEPEIAKLPVDKREVARAEKLRAYTTEMERNLASSVSQCEDANNAAQIDCMIAARTADAATKCTE